MCLGIPARIVELEGPEPGLATVDVSGVRREISVALVDDPTAAPLRLGDWVLVHVGFAMSRIDEAQAAETLKILTALGEAQAEIEAMRQSAAELRRAQS